MTAFTFIMLITKQKKPVRVKHQHDILLLVIIRYHVIYCQPADDTCAIVGIKRLLSYIEHDSLLHGLCKICMNNISEKGRLLKIHF